MVCSIKLNSTWITQIFQSKIKRKNRLHYASLFPNRWKVALWYQIMTRTVLNVLTWCCASPVKAISACPHAWFEKLIHIYRITAVIKDETDIIASILSLIRKVVMLVIMYMYVKNFKTNFIVFISNVMSLISNWLIFFSIRVNTLIMTISLREI